MSRPAPAIGLPVGAASESADIERVLADISATGAYHRRIREVPGCAKLGIARAVNALLAEVEARDTHLKRRLDELVDARDDAQTANLMLRRLKEDLRARTDQLDGALKQTAAASGAKSQFLANMSHEIRTPMNGILGMAELLRRTELNERQRQQVNTIVHSGRALLQIINDILDFSKVESGRFDLDPKPFDLKLCLGDIVELLRPTASAKSLTLKLEMDAGLPRYYIGDAGRIRQIVMNLAGNAVKFTDCGSVTINLSGQKSDARVSLVIDVIDTGIGIPADRLGDVFEKFSQVDQTCSRRYEGTGLGLSIGQLLARRMEGDISVASEFGKGSTFSFRLKLAACENVASDTRSDANGTISLDRQTSSRAPETQDTIFSVLVVDDSVVNQEVAREFLEELHCDVSIACNGEEALAAAAAARFDLVLMDCQMPVMDGFKATAAIRSQRVGATSDRVPIVALTANAFASDREKCLAAGMSDFLSKPFTPSDFEAVVRKWRLAAQDPAAICNA